MEIPLDGVCTVGDLKARAYEAVSRHAAAAGASMPDVGDLKMMWEGRNLEWDRPLADYGITTESKVLLCSRVHAAMEGTYMAVRKPLQLLPPL